MPVPTPFKRLILRAVLRNVSPMVIRLAAVPDFLDLAEFDAVFRAGLGSDSGIGYAFQVHGQEFNSFSRRTKSQEAARFEPPSAGEVSLYSRRNGPMGMGAP